MIQNQSVQKVNAGPISRIACSTCGAIPDGPSTGNFLNGEVQLSPEIQPLRPEAQLLPAIRQAIHRSALEIIATESRCVEWEAPAFRSVELAEEAITEIVTFALSTSQARLKEKVEAILDLLHEATTELSPPQQKMMRELRELTSNQAAVTLVK